MECSEDGFLERQADLRKAWNAATDLVFAFYPILIVWGLQMRLRMKFSVVVLMGMGVFTAVCSIIKTVNFQTEKSTSDITCKHCRSHLPLSRYHLLTSPLLT